MFILVGIGSDSSLVKQCIFGAANSGILRVLLILPVLSLELCSLKYHRTDFWGEDTRAFELQVATVSLLVMGTCMCSMALSSNHNAVQHFGRLHEVCCVTKPVLSLFSLEFLKIRCTELAFCLTLGRWLWLVLSSRKGGHAQEVWQEVISS